MLLLQTLPIIATEGLLYSGSVAGEVCYNVGGYAIVFYINYEEEIKYVALIYIFIKCGLE